MKKFTIVFKRRFICLLVCLSFLFCQLALNETSSVFATGGDPGPEILSNPSFNNGTENWNCYREGAAQVISGLDMVDYDTAPAGFMIQCVNKGESASNIQLFTMPLDIVGNKIYLFTFRAKCSYGFKIPSIKLMKAASPWTPYANPYSGLNITNEWQTYAVIFKANTTASDGRITFFMGNALPEGATFHIDTLSLREYPSGELLPDPGFDTGNSGWYFNCSNSAECYNYLDSTDLDTPPVSYRIQCINSGNSMNDIQLFTMPINIEQNKKYQLMFRAKCSSGFAIPSIRLMKAASPWTLYDWPCSGLITGNDWQSYMYTFTANTTAADGRITFYLGNALPSGAVFRIDSVSLKEVTAPVIPTITPTATPAVTPTLIPTPTVSPTPTETPSPSQTATPAVTPTLTPTPTVSPTPTETPSPTPPSATVYTAGSYYNGTMNIPCYWTGTTRTDLPCGTGGGVAHSIYVSGGIIYTAGSYYNGTINIPCYWTGTTRTDLPCGTGGGYTNSIYVSGGTVYTTGKYYDGSSNVACYWTGTTRTNLTSSGSVYSICVSGSTVYTAGYYNDGTNFIPCYWTGTTRTNLPGGTRGGNANSIYISSGTIYIAGNYYDGSKHYACYWTGMTRTDLPCGTDSSDAYSIYVSGGTVYTAGGHTVDGYNIPCYWTGTTRTELSGIDVRSIYVFDGKVYTAGVYSNDTDWIACYWTGTTRTELSGYTAHSIFVK